MPESTTMVPPTPPRFDEARLVIAGFLARYSGVTRKSYATDLRHISPRSEARTRPGGITEAPLRRSGAGLLFVRRSSKLAR